MPPFRGLGVRGVPKAGHGVGWSDRVLEAKEKTPGGRQRVAEVGEA